MAPTPLAVASPALRALAVAAILAGATATLPLDATGVVALFQAGVPPPNNNYRIPSIIGAWALQVEPCPRAPSCPLPLPRVRPLSATVFRPDVSM